MAEEESSVLRLHKEVFDEFNDLMISTKLDQNELLTILIGIFKRFGNNSDPSHRTHELPAICQEHTDGSILLTNSHDSNHTTFKITNEGGITRNTLPLELNHSAPKCKAHRRNFKTKRRLKKSSRNLKDKRVNQTEIPVPVLDVSNFSLQLGSLEIADGNAFYKSPHQAFENLSCRRSSRKATSPKRKQTEAMHLGVESPVSSDRDKITCQNSPITPKRRRKNKPQKLVQQISLDDNSASEPENEMHTLASDVIQSTANSVEQIQLPKERKSKTNAKAVIGELAEALLDVTLETQEEESVTDTQTPNDAVIDYVETDEVDDIVLPSIHGQNLPFDIYVDNADDDDMPKALWTSLEYISIPPKVGRPKGSKTRPEAERRPYKCEHCQASFKHPSHLTRHVDRLHSGYAPYRCRGCGKTFNSEMLLRYHEGFGCKLYQLPFQCKMCLIRFDTEDEVSSHKCSRDPKKKCVCPNCDYKTASPRDMEQHVKIHTGEKSFKCDQCDFSTAWKKNLKEHALKHLGVKPFVCDVCGYATNDPHNLRAHKFTHLIEKSFMCEICGAKFREARLLKGHQLVHNTEKPFKCTICKYSCKHKSSLRYHITSHSNAKKLMCEQCGQNFRSKRHMARHQKAVHQDSHMIYGCRYCDFTAPVSQSLNSHMRKHSKKGKKANSSRHCVKEHAADETMKVSGDVHINATLTRQDEIGHLFRFEAPQQEHSQHSLCSSAVDLFRADIKSLDGMATIGSTQDSQEARPMQSPLLSQLSISPGDVLAVLPCFNTNSATFQGVASNPEQADSIRPQYEELLFNSNASQAETISTMMSLIREFRPR